MTGAYRELFTAIATSAATLTGLLFVAVSLAEGRARAHPVVRELRAAAALLAFINALAVSLLGLVPNDNIGYPAGIFGAIGILFTLAGLRTIRALTEQESPHRPQLVLMAGLLVMFGFELSFGVEAVASPHVTSPVTAIGDVLIASLLIGIARAWELVGGWSTGAWASLATISGRRSPTRDREEQTPPEDGP